MFQYPERYGGTLSNDKPHSTAADTGMSSFDIRKTDANQAQAAYEATQTAQPNSVEQPVSQEQTPTSDLLSGGNLTTSSVTIEAPQMSYQNQDASNEFIQYNTGYSAPSDLQLGSTPVMSEE